MIDERLRTLIYPYLKMNLEEEERKFADYLLDNAYLVEEGGEQLITTPPAPTSDMKYGLQFSSLNGAFVSICFWEDAKRKGVKL